MTRQSYTKAYILSGTLGIVLLGAWVHLSLVSQRSERISILTVALEQQKQLSSSLPDTDELAILQAQLNDYLDGGVPALLTTITDDINALASGSYTVSTGTPVTTDSLSLTYINVTFEGSYASTYELIRRITSYSYPVRIEELIITQDTTQSDNELAVLLRLLVITNFI